MTFPPQTSSRYFVPGGPGGELLAENTTEAIRVVRRGQWVYKFLKPAHLVPFGLPESRERELCFRVIESHVHAELNPLWMIAEHNCLASRFVDGRPATIEEAGSLQDRFARTGRGYIKDCGPANIRVIEGRPVVIDFVVITVNRAWRSRLSVLKRQHHCNLPRYPGPSLPFSLFSVPRF